MNVLHLRFILLCVKWSSICMKTVKLLCTLEKNQLQSKFLRKLFQNNTMGTRIAIFISLFFTGK